MNATVIYNGVTSTVANIIGVESERLSKAISNMSSNMSSDDISPVTLSSAWSRVARLLLLASLAVSGSVGNVFMISAVVVEDQLNKRGNAFLVNVALADLLVTGLVIPVSVIVILAGYDGTPAESLGACRFEWTLEALCFLVTVLTLATIAAENYARLCLPPERYANLTPGHVTATIIVLWLIAVTVVALQSFLDIGPDFCRRKLSGIAMEQAVGAGIFVGLPALTTIFLYVKLVIRVRRATRGSYKPPAAFSWDYELAKTNMCSCVMFVVFWLPYGTAVCVNSFVPVNASVFYNLAWFALSKSCFNNLLYCVADRHFRSAYVKLFHYCCCKTTVSFSRRPREGRNASDVRLRVHIIHSYASPSSCRPAVARPNGRDVYEL
ncbi:histamine H2 receptor-like [Temnothorax curvispinosus]|uniref:Histamine H2 receptor-like n=1 Tax=Temnothorax curvispinosus TaxID=300111 RepID=A0A6J1R9F0_9HYME|nr:histamine H2 receptor-like [Temnothorax curvispinosus]XP_024891659.1 histamine H2 receptor-like [Temnothorax curvispinosus]XP_024891660.1 histamine H2 receptor-like [Temnothorax curvispinosus]XP_024891661.1 histamine H2 receptor-like [Temnothorax curvispinosus]XP_024891662.1 histamine H2 receptor-like [Temnothorax curvispinosus]XP_024891663.1 histamine H2 receptor-like [Temnothorax curvispinosus]XP_024891664.1 histamine H2 receptor-like [Temnothorax curvispinosus]XP_024891665.1 histamine 